jgi:hypothetical protein
MSLILYEFEYNDTTQSLYTTRELVSTLFDNMFNQVNEIHQPEFTYKHVSSFSGID